MKLIAKAIQIWQDEGIFSLAKRGQGFIKHKLNSAGQSRKCPVCGWTGRKFLSGGHPRRKEKACPGCGAAERHRLLSFYLTQGDYDISEDDVLYFAPVDKIEQNLREISSVTTFDLDMENIDVRGDIAKLPFSESTFDTIICSHVLEHIPNDLIAMSEMYRVLKKGGNALIMVPKNKSKYETYEDSSIVSPEERRKEFGGKSHVRYYGEDIVDRLSETGFEVKIESPSSEIDVNLVRRFGLRRHGPKYTISDDRHIIEYEDIHKCEKR